MRGIKDITIVAVFTAVLFVQEQLLSFLPNIQLTIFLLVLYSKIFGFTRTSVIIIFHVLLDNLLVGSFNIIFTPFMLMGWMLIPLVLCTVMKKVENIFILSFMGIVFAFLYSWIFLIPNILVYDISVGAYLATDILWEIVLAGCSFLTILWLYHPCSKLLLKLNGNRSYYK